MPVDVGETKPVLVHINPQEWAEFKRLVGNRRASMRIRALVRSDIKRQKRIIARRNQPCI